MSTSPVDVERVERAVRELLIAVGEDPDRGGLRETPNRVARACVEMFAGLRVDPAALVSTFDEPGARGLVLFKDISFHSLCEHKLVPFSGVAHVAYVPGESGRMTGPGALAKMVEAFARRPQLQERLTGQVADVLWERLQPRGVLVVVECEHMCVTMLDARNASSRMVTSAVRGWFEKSPAARAEAMNLINGRR